MGTEAEVTQYRDKLNPDGVAVKRAKLSSLEKMQERIQEREVLTLLKGCSPFVVSMIQYYQNFRDSAGKIEELRQHAKDLSYVLLLIFPLAQGSLQDYSESKRELPFERLVALVLQTYQGLLDLHKLGFVHRDLKPANILEISNTFQLADFGCTLLPEQLQSQHLILDTAGTPGFQCPQYEAYCAGENICLEPSENEESQGQGEDEDDFLPDEAG